MIELAFSVSTHSFLRGGIPCSLRYYKGDFLPSLSMPQVIKQSLFLCISILLCSGMTPLHFALASGNEDMVQLLKKAGAAQETGEVVDFIKKKVAASRSRFGK